MVLFYFHWKKSLKIPKGGNQNRKIDEGQTTQWPKEKGQKDKQRSTKHTYKTKDRATSIPPKTGVNSGARKGVYCNLMSLFCYFCFKDIFLVLISGFKLLKLVQVQITNIY